jgi:hypothetical protein
MAKIKRFPCYEFLESGHVLSNVKRNPKVLTPIRMGGYVGLQIVRSDGLIEKQYVHRLICEAFRGPCPDGMECRHLDGNSKNNHANNLVWGTKSENSLDRNDHGTGVAGENNPMAKLNKKRVKEMRKHRDKTGDSYKIIGRIYGVSTMTAFRAITKQSWGSVTDDK